METKSKFPVSWAIASFFILTTLCLASILIGEHLQKPSSSNKQVKELPLLKSNAVSLLPPVTTKAVSTAEVLKVVSWQVGFAGDRGHPDFDFGVVRGIVRNDSERIVQAVTVGFNLYDRQSNQVDYTEASMVNLQPHGAWKFETTPFRMKRPASWNAKVSKLEGISE